MNNGNAQRPMLGDGDYRRHQDAQDREYVAACAEFLVGRSPEEIEQLKQAGVLREVKRNSGLVELVFADTGRDETPTRGRGAVGAEDDAVTLCEDSLSFCDWPEFDVDKMPEQLREAFGLDVGQSVEVTKFIEKLVKRAEMQTNGLLLSRVVGMFLATPKNLVAQAHGLAHASRLAQDNGFPSIRASAKATGISHEWIRKSANHWVKLLDLPPLEGAKSDEAKEAYKKNADTNHWRKQTCKATKQSKQK